jgi:hypothetical protein
MLLVFDSTIPIIPLIDAGRQLFFWGVTLEYEYFLLMKKRFLQVFIYMRDII